MNERADDGWVMQNERVCWVNAKQEDGQWVVQCQTRGWVMPEERWMVGGSPWVIQDGRKRADNSWMMQDGRAGEALNLSSKHGLWFISRGGG